MDERDFDDGGSDDDQERRLAELMRRLGSGELDASDLQRLQEEIGGALGIRIDPAQMQMAMAQVQQMMWAPREEAFSAALTSSSVRPEREKTKTSSPGRTSRVIFCMMAGSELANTL